ncbi:MAG: hypothetical protein HY516_02450 [Candidatus Aenigmarchaeota archaeon]|nr:hypothetical protein [Candidatus Aenigmarchaeota archaeon]
MTTGVLERPAVTELYAETEAVARLTSVAGGIQDHSITVIENPSVHGFTGFLLSERLTRGHDELIPQRVIHYRVDAGNRPSSTGVYPWVRIRKGFDGGSYNFVQAEQFVLPNPSKRLYEVRFITPGDFFSVREMLGGGIGTAQKGVERIYELVAERSSIFSVDGRKLRMPEDYASFRVGR